MYQHLESTDAAPEVPHPRPTRDAASDVVARAPDRVCIFFFFSRIRADSTRFAPMRLDSCRIGFDSRRIGFDSRRIGLIRPESGRIGHIGSYRPATDTADTAETGRKRPKTAEIGLKTRRSSQNSDLRCVFCLLLSLFYESSILMCFLRIF